MLKKMENEKGIVARFVIGKRYPCIIVVHVFVIYFLSVLLSTIMDHDENIKNGFPCSLAVQIPGTIWIVVLTMKTGSLMTSSFLYVHEICGDFRMP
jgi:MFS-type transporter involved in bile tolerance (Atg22 family)